MGGEEEVELAKKEPTSPSSFQHSKNVSGFTPPGWR